MRRFWILLFFSLLVSPLHAEEQPPALRLDEVIQEVIEKNPEIRAAREKQQAARERIGPAGSWDDPGLSLTQREIPSSFNLFGANETWYSLSQNIPLGKNRLRRKIATFGSDIADEEFRGTRRRIIARAKQAYYDLFLAHKTLEIHHEHLLLVQNASQIAKEKFAVGTAGQQDVIRAQVEGLDISNTLMTLEQERETAAARLNTLSDRPASSPLGVPQTPTLLSSELPFGLSIETLQEEARAARAENRIQELAIQQSAETVRLAQQGRLPDLMGEIAYGDIQGGPNRWMAEIRISLPWFNKTKYDARVRENEAEQRHAQATYQAAIHETQFRVQALFAQFQTNRRRVRLYEEGILPLAEQSLEVATIGYQTKKNDFLTLIDAEKNLREIKLTYFRFLAETHKILAELEEVIGRTF